MCSIRGSDQSADSTISRMIEPESYDTTVRRKNILKTEILVFLHASSRFLLVSCPSYTLNVMCLLCSLNWNHTYTLKYL